MRMKSSFESLRKRIFGSIKEKGRRGEKEIGRRRKEMKGRSPKMNVRYSRQLIKRIQGSL
jgi:hypothetical protein